MNYPRVNLLKKSEQRYQGAVSRRFLLACIVVTPILFITLLSGVKLIQYSSVQSSLKSSGEVWMGLKSRLALYKDEQKSLATNRRALELIAGWKGTQIPLSELLIEIQGAVPANIQLTRLAIRSEPETSIYDKPEDFTLNYTLVVQGIAQGDRAEEVVIGLRKELLKTERMGAAFDSVTLGSMRKRVGRDGKAMQEFSLDGSGAEGGGQ
jgi:hypothetical protein